MIRALAVDIDGTLSDQNRMLCPAALQALRRLNVPVVLSTGNTHCFTRTVAILLGTPSIFIAENGGIISLSDDEMEIQADLKVCEVIPQVVSRVSPAKIQLRSLQIYRYCPATQLRCTGSCSPCPRVRPAVELIDTTYATHIKDQRVDKGTGLRRIAERMQIDLSEFAAIGDSDSDIPMFMLAGFRASVGNASSKLKQISDYVAKAEYGNGFAEIINQLNEKKMF